MTGVVKSVGKYALLAGSALALSISAASAASMAKAGMDKRVADLEREVTLLKNQMKQAMAVKPTTRGMVSGGGDVKVALYGWVNTMIRVASTSAKDGTSFQALDNLRSGSRFGIKGTGQITKDLSGTAHIEVGVTGTHRGAGLGALGATPTIYHRIADVSLTHKDLGTVSVGHGWLAGSSSMVANLTGTIHVFDIWGPSLDGVLAAPQGSQMASVKRHGAGVIAAFGSRAQRVLYRTPSVMGASLEASYNQNKGFSAGLSVGDLPGVKDFSFRFNAGFFTIPKVAATAMDDEVPAQTSMGVSAAVKHNASGLNATGVYGQHQMKGGVKYTGWMGAGGWTGKINDAGATSVTLGYGQWGDGMSKSTQYHFAVNQSIAAAGTDVYFGVAYDTGNYTHTVNHMDARDYTGVDTTTGEPTRGLPLGGVADPDGDGTNDFVPYDSTVDSENYKADTACGAIPRTGTAVPTAVQVAAHQGTQCAVKRSGVIVVLAGVRVKF